jgi:hypothetical protein
MVTDRDAGSTSSHSDFSFRVLPVPAPGGIASPRSVVPKAQPACRSSHQNTSLSLLRRCGARGRAPSRSGPSPPSVPYFDAHAWQARAAAGPGAGRDRVLAIRRSRSPARLSIDSSEYVFKLGSSLRRARAHALPVRAQPAPLSAPYFDAHGWQARAAAGPDAGEGSRPRDPSFPEPSPLVDPVIRIRP